MQTFYNLDTLNKVKFAEKAHLKIEKYVLFSFSK